MRSWIVPHELKFWEEPVEAPPDRIAPPGPSIPCYDRESRLL